MPTAPSFWYEKPASLIASLLKPFSWLYGAVAWLVRHISPTAKVAAPVICIGNCVVGGSGKTPVVADFAKRFAARGINVNIVSRGYGGVLFGPVRVDAATQQAYDVGDEPLMLSKIVPVWVAKNRVAGAVAAILYNDAKLLLLDDGLQNYSLRKDASVLVVDGASGIGNGLLLPAGPLREPLKAALKRVKAVVFIGAMNALYHEIAAVKPVFRADIYTHCDDSLKDKNVFAFTGIAHANKFFDGLERCGAHVVVKRSFPDHHTWTREELEAMLEEAKNSNLLPVSTAKDVARMPDDLKKHIAMCDAIIRWEDEMALDVFLNTLWADFNAKN